MTREEIKTFINQQMDDCELVATQKKVSSANVQINIKRLSSGDVPPAILINGNLIINGHHRYIAGAIVGQIPESIPWQKNSDTEEFKWSSLIVEDELWQEY